MYRYPLYPIHFEICGSQDQVSRSHRLVVTIAVSPETPHLSVKASGIGSKNKKHISLERVLSCSKWKSSFRIPL